ncbi:MAG: tetratricopeptide repeat protein [Chromatiaceae bacterium]|nr:tetratricopeptide repeat protein [Chromatiaceae bacterium]
MQSDREGGVLNCLVLSRERRGADHRVSCCSGLPKRATGERLFVFVLGLALCGSTAAQTFNRNVSWPGNTLAGVQCYGDAPGYGPYDYVTERGKIEIVEKYHFNPTVQRLAFGGSGVATGVENNLDYTLRAVPNHHLALWAVTRYYLDKRKARGEQTVEHHERSRTGNPPPECYFQRAQVFAPSDGMVSAIYGIYLHKRGALAEALIEYQRAEKLIPNNAELAYNTGLLYFEMANMEKASEYAERAKALGYPLNGLRDKIDRRVAETRSE